MSRQSVITNIKSLVDKGFLVKERTRHYGANLYRINREITGQIFLPDRKLKQKTGRKSLPDQVKNLDLKQVKNFDPNLLSLKPVIKNHGSPKDYIKWFCKKYEELLGVPYVPVWGKDTNLLKPLLAKFSYQRAQEIGVLYLECNDPFITQNRGIPMLRNQWQRFATEGATAAQEGSASLPLWKNGQIIPR